MIVKKEKTFAPISITMTDHEELQLMYNILATVAASSAWLEPSRLFALNTVKRLEKEIDG